MTQLTKIEIFNPNAPNLKAIDLTAWPEWPFLALLLILRLFTAGSAGLVPDESYYWLWAQHLSAGYYDHPPMVAWWIWAGTLFSDSAFWVRLPFVLSFVALCVVVYDTAHLLFSDSVARRAVVWLNASLLLSVGSVIATPDPPSVLFWASALWALARLIRSGKGMWWLVFGLFAGLGCLAKYTNLFLGLGVLLWFILDAPARRWLRTPWPWLSAILAVAVLSPNLFWNANHGWLTVDKQFGRIGASHFTLQYLIEFLISQPLLLNPLIFAFVALGASAWLRNRGDDGLALLIAIPLPFIAYLLIHVFHDRIQGNWPAPLYPGLILLAAAIAQSASEKWTWLCKAAAPLGIVLSLAALLYLALGQGLTGAAGLSLGWDRLSSQIVAKAQASGATWVATTDYDMQGELSYHVRQIPVIGVSERDRYSWPSHEAALIASPALIVVTTKHTPDLAQCFSELADLGTASRLKKADRKSDAHLYRGRLKYVGCDVSIEPMSPQE